MTQVTDAPVLRTGPCDLSSPLHRGFYGCVLKVHWITKSNRVSMYLKPCLTSAEAMFMQRSQELTSKWTWNQVKNTLKCPINPHQSLPLCPDTGGRAGSRVTGCTARLCHHTEGTSPFFPHCRHSPTKPHCYLSPFFFLYGQISWRLSSTRYRQQCQGGQRTKCLAFAGNEEYSGLLWKYYHTRLTALTVFLEAIPKDPNKL